MTRPWATRASLKIVILATQGFKQQKFSRAKTVFICKGCTDLKLHAQLKL